MEFTTTFYSDFCIANRFGFEAVRDTFRRAFAEWKNRYMYLTGLVVALNRQCWANYESNSELCALYSELYSEARDYGLVNLKDEELEYFFRMTD